MLKQLRGKLIDVLLSDLTAISWLLGWIGIIFGFGLLFANTGPGAYHLMLSIAPSSAWATAFVVYGMLKFHGCLIDKAGFGAIISSFTGLWLWCYTFASFASNPLRAIGAADMTVIAIVLCEVWIAAQAISDRRVK